MGPEMVLKHLRCPGEFKVWVIQKGPKVLGGPDYGKRHLFPHPLPSASQDLSAVSFHRTLCSSFSKACPWAATSTSTAMDKPLRASTREQT